MSKSKKSDLPVILVTNDDGVMAPGIMNLVEAVKDLGKVVVVAPALQDDALHFWLSDADEAIGRADAVRRQTVEKLAAEGVPASGDTGDSDPLEAIEDALQTFPAERVLLFTHGQEQQRYREDVDPGQVSERFGVPAERVPVS